MWKKKELWEKKKIYEGGHFFFFGQVIAAQTKQMVVYV